MTCRAHSWASGVGATLFQFGDKRLDFLARFTGNRGLGYGLDFVGRPNGNPLAMLDWLRQQSGLNAGIDRGARKARGLAHGVQSQQLQQVGLHRTLSDEGLVRPVPVQQQQGVVEHLPVNSPHKGVGSSHGPPHQPTELGKNFHRIFVVGLAVGPASKSHLTY